MEQLTAPEESLKPRYSTRLIVALILGATVLAAASFAAGFFSAPVTVTPTSTSAEAGFARDMQAHHSQAVEMSLTVRELTDDPAIRLLAYDIATTQQQQVGQMYGWLRMWGLPQAAPEPSMTWMTRPSLEGMTEHSGMDGDPSSMLGEPMPGMATPEQMTTLSTLSGVAAERFYLELMVAHHQGGISMAQAALDRTVNPQVTSLARGMIAAQQSEIEYMNELLAERSAS